MGLTFFDVNLLRDIARSQRTIFGPRPPDQSQKSRMVAAVDATKQTTLELIGDRTNKREQTNKDCASDQINLSDKCRSDKIAARLDDTGITDHATAGTDIAGVFSTTSAIFSAR